MFLTVSKMFITSQYNLEAIAPTYLLPTCFHIFYELLLVYLLFISIKQVCCEISREVTLLHYQ